MQVQRAGIDSRLRWGNEIDSWRLWNDGGCASQPPPTHVADTSVYVLNKSVFVDGRRDVCTNKATRVKDAKENRSCKVVLLEVLGVYVCSLQHSPPTSNRMSTRTQCFDSFSASAMKVLMLSIPISDCRRHRQHSTNGARTSPLPPCRRKSAKRRCKQRASQTTRQQGNQGRTRTRTWSSNRS